MRALTVLAILFGAYAIVIGASLLWEAKPDQGPSWEEMQVEICEYELDVWIRRGNPPQEFACSRLRVRTGAPTVASIGRDIGQALCEIERESYWAKLRLGATSWGQEDFPNCQQ